MDVDKQIKMLIQICRQVRQHNKTVQVSFQVSRETQNISL